jgi:hypothetical protein
MWNPLSLLGSSIFVEASVDEVEPLEPLVTRMEGNNATALIAARMGNDQNEVGSRLVSLHQKGELDGTAGGHTNRPNSQPDAEGVANVSLTSKDLEEFERAEAEGTDMITAPTPHKHTLKPSVLGAPKTPSTPAAPPPSAAPYATESAGIQADRIEVAMDSTSGAASTADLHTVSDASKWCDDMEATTEEVAGDVDAVEPEVDRAHGEYEVEDEVWPEPRRFGEAVEAENIYGGLAAIELPLLDNDSTVGELQSVVQELVGQVNVAHKALATAGYIIAERSREALQQSKIGSDLATEALLKAYEVAAVAASSSRQSWKMCVQMAGPDMPPRSKDAERKPKTTGGYLATKLFGVKLRPEEVVISHFRGPSSNKFILKFTKTGFGSSYEDLLHASKAMGLKRKLNVYAKIPQADIDQELYFLLRCMVKAGEAENSYTAHSGRPAAWLIQDGESARIVSAR